MVNNLNHILLRELKKGIALLSLVVSLSIQASSNGVSEQKLDLRGLVVNAFNHQPGMAISFYETKRKGNDFHIAKAELYPSLDYSATSQNIRKEHESQLETNLENKISLSQRVTDFGGRKARIKKAEYEKHSADIDFDKTMITIARQVSASWLNINKSKEILNGINEEKLFYKKMLDNFSLLVSSGATMQSDLRKVQASIDVLNTREIMYRSALDTEVFRLSNMVGFSLTAEQLENQSVIFDIYEFIPEPEKIMDMVMKSSYDYQMMISAREAALQERKSAKAAYYPTVDLAGSYVKNSPGGSADLEDYKNEFRVDLSLRFNLFNGFRNSEENMKAASAYEQEKLKIDDFILKSRADINDMVAKYNAANETHTVAIRSYENALKLSELYSQEFQLGQKSLLDLISSRNESFQAYITMIESQYERYSAKLEQMVVISSLISFLDLDKLRQTYNYEPKAE